MGDAPERSTGAVPPPPILPPVERHGRAAGYCGSGRAGRDRPRGLSSPRSTACRSTMRREEGFVRDNEFLHPCCKLGFKAPRDFRLYNDQDGVLGVGRDHSLLFFSCTRSVPGSLAEWMRNKLKPTPTDIQAAEIDGAEAAIGARPRGSDTGLGQVRYVLVRHGDRVCYFNLLSEGPDRDRRIDVLVAAARTFRTLSDAEAAALQPYRLRVVSPEGAPPRNSPPPALRRFPDGTAARAERRRQCRRAQQDSVKTIEP